MAAKKKEATKAAEPMKTPLRVGNTVFIRTVTHYYTGRIEAVDAQEILLREAAWIADTGRFANMLKSGAPGEVEPYPGGVSVSRGAMVDCCDWPHALPKVQR